ncbi:MAG: serine/threonine protein phosphatase [Clostridium sp.]|nr:serine/threonine protein phosphatase [Clostridium sp.]
MNILKRLSKIFSSSEVINFDDTSKIVLLSDCHRGDGNQADNFSKNQNIYFYALKYYYRNDFTYIEIGDGDELWEIKKMCDIKQEHSHIFWLLSKFFKENRLYFIYGNHDMVKKDEKFVKENLYEYFDENTCAYKDLFKEIKIHEGLVLSYRGTEDKILLIHGHQGDFINDTLWKVSRFLVRYLWRPLETYGINDPTRTAKNYKKKELVEKRLIRWVKKEKHILISGHTHRPMFPGVNEVPYFNDGSCVHPRCITTIEIKSGEIMLVKWCVKTRDDGSLFIDRDILVGPAKLKDYFDAIRENKF